MKNIITYFLLILFSAGCLRADEGMWPLTMLQKLQDDMQSKGLLLTAEDIYSLNNSSLKDGVVRLMQKNTNRMFCTGEIISKEGLFLTNHHCGYNAIQALSTPADNILENGFWAKTKADERKATFNVGRLDRMEDVTDQVLKGVNFLDPESERNKQITINKDSLEKYLAAGNKNIFVEIIPFYNGNKYLAMFYEVFTDVRLVGTPPQNIGKFGGETDNWMWPRHTCDFSMFRIYTNKDNQPAEFGEENIPYKPKFHFPISLKGIKPGDFAMIMGYPGRTARYTYSEGIKYISEKDRPIRVNIRRNILDVYEKYMYKIPEIKLMYADNYAGLSNYWKKFLGERDALKKLNVYDRRKTVELEFEAWVRANNLTEKYGNVTSILDEAYTQLNNYGPYQIYLQECVLAPQPSSTAYQYIYLYNLFIGKSDKAKEVADKFYSQVENRFKEFYAPIELEVLEAMLTTLYEEIDRSLLPEYLLNLAKKYKYNYKEMAKDMFNKSIFTSKEKLAKFHKKPSSKALKNDPIFRFVYEYNNRYEVDFLPVINAIQERLYGANRLFQAALLEMYPDKLLTPDANATMRLTYGKVMDYEAKDAVHYKEFTTGRGILEKYIPGDIEFNTPPELITLIKSKNYGQYARPDGELPVCFLTTNDITGGNSGSPVINGNGELIGTAFDGNWEAISGDFAFEPSLQRTISVDIRFTLFILDKFGNASHLLQEMTLVR